MKVYIIFFAAFILVFIAGNVYVSRLGRWVFSGRRSRRIYTGVYIVLSASYLSGRVLEHFYPAGIPSYICSLVGAYWFAFMFYGGMGVAVIDLTVISGHILGRIRRVPFNAFRLRFSGACAVLAMICVIIIVGAINAQNRSVRQIVIKSDQVSRPVSIVLVTDIHMGILINSNDVLELSERINKIPRDIVIIGGDFFDGDLASVLSEGVELDKTRITAPLGVFAVTGNHDYFGNIDKAVEFIAARGIRVLMDECVSVGGLRIAGREDVHGVQVTGKERMSLRRILGEKGGKYPLIVVDHTPSSITESVNAGALLHLSGHTHAGQMWPIGMITSRIYPLDWGYRIIGKTHCYVSSGYGSWGPPVRIGNTPEIVRISILPL